MITQTESKPDGKLKWMIAVMAIICLISFLPWFVDCYKSWVYDVALNGNLSYDLANGKVLPIFSYLYVPHTFGPIAFPFFLLAPLYKMFGPYNTLIGFVQFILLTIGILSWLTICGEIDKRLVLLFGIFVILAPPLFKHTIPYAWGTHPESVALQAILFILFVKLYKKEFKSKILTLIFGLIGGFATFFLISNGVFILTLLIVWAILNGRALIFKAPYFALGFIIGVSPLIVRLTLYSGFGEFLSWYFHLENQTPHLPSANQFFTTLSNSLSCLILSPEFKHKAMSIAYILLALTSYFILLINLIRKNEDNRHLLAIILYPVIYLPILSLTKRGEFFNIYVCSDANRYFLTFYPIFFFLLGYLVLTLYKKSKIIGVLIGSLLVFGFVLKEPSYIFHLKSLVSMNYKTVLELKVYKGLDRYRLWSETLPNYASKMRTSYLAYTKKANDWERWLFCQQLGRWIYKSNRDELGRAHSYAKSLEYESFFLKGLGWGLAENILLELNRKYAGSNFSEQRFIRDFEASLKSETEAIEFAIDNEHLLKGVALGIAFELGNYSDLNNIPIAFTIALIDKIPLSSRDKTDAIIEGLFWRNFTNSMYCLIEKICLQEGLTWLGWLYDMKIDDQDYYHAVGKALSYGFVLKNFYVPRKLLSDERVKAGVKEGLSEIGFELGDEKDGYFAIALKKSTIKNHRYGRN